MVKASLCIVTSFNRELIFEQPFCDNFCDKFISYSHCVFTFSLYCYRFCVNTHISLYILVVPQVVNKNGCSNNTPLFNSVILWLLLTSLPSFFSTLEFSRYILVLIWCSFIFLHVFFPNNWYQ
jgi:hypothetical protein